MDKKIVVAALLAVMGNSAYAATLDLDLTANDGSRWYEFATDGFLELGSDRGATSTVAGAQGAWQISEFQNNGSYVGLGGGDIAFPTANFSNIGAITYDDSGLTGSGTESASISGFSADFGQYIGVRSVGGSHINPYELPYTTTVDSASGSLEFVDGTLSAINLNAGVTLTYLAVPLFGINLPFSGDFTITGNEFALSVGDAATTTVGANVWVWDVTGSVDGVSEVPVPAAAWLFGSALLGLFGASRKRAN